MHRHLGAVYAQTAWQVLYWDFDIVIVFFLWRSRERWHSDIAVG